MPIYEYKCNVCGKEFEYQQRMSDPEKTECEACGKSALERLISRTVFQLKGSGWYKDLYASAKPGDSKAKDTSSSDASGGGEKKAEPAKTESTSTPSPAGGSTGTSGSGSSGGSGTGGSSTSTSAS